MIADAQGQGTITNDDSATLSINDVSVTEGNSGTTNARFTVTLSMPSASAVTVAYATANGTATAGSDYTAKSGTLTFAAGTTSQTIDVPVIGDTTVEPNETFFVNLSNASGATIADGQGQGTIVNDDSAALPTLSVNDVSVAEGNVGGTSLAFSVTLSSASSSTVTVGYATADGTATAGSDYVAQSGTLTFAAGQTSKAVTITVNGDTTVEPDETFFLNLSNPSGATIADGQGQGTIRNDDVTPILPAISINDVSDVEGNVGGKSLGFTVSLSTPSASTVTVNYATADGTATAGSDYVAQSGTLTFAAGQVTRAIIVSINGDSTPEPNETFFVNLSAPSGATLADAQGQATILNDDSRDARNNVVPVSWKALVGVRADGSSLTKTTGTGQDSGAVSVQQIASRSAGYIEWTASETTTYRAIGLSRGNTNSSGGDIDFAIELTPEGNGRFYVLEKGASRGNFGTYVPGDVFRVSVSGGRVNYSRNGVVFYTSGQGPKFPLLVDTWLYTAGATINGAVISTGKSSRATGWLSGASRAR
jgi:Calx-beta domain